jgi:CubicO group peptidase (beta-lactamase class C family)
MYNKIVKGYNCIRCYFRIDNYGGLCMKKSFRLAAICAAVMFLSGCIGSNSVTSTQPHVKSEVERSYWPTETWRTALPDEHNMNAAALNDLIEIVDKEDIYSMVIVKDGYIVTEYYDNKYKENSYLRFNSCAKSVTSALMGIAIDKGYIENIDTKIVDFYPEIDFSKDDERKKQVTLKNLLNSTSGIRWPEWTEWEYGIGHMVKSNDWTRFILSRDIEEEPGVKFNYSTGGAHLLSAILTKETGRSTLEFAKGNLFRPLGISRIRWIRDPRGIYAGGHGIEFTARDAAKFGFLYLNKGVWDGKRVISESWIDQSVKAHSEGDERFGQYGYQWWIRTFKVDEKSYDSYFAMGDGGQYIFVVPKADMVVVFAGWTQGDERLNPIKYMESHILKALK